MEVTNEIKDICSELLERYKKSIEDSGHVASGGLVNNATYQVVFNGSCLEVSFNLEQHWKYLENGTRPHFPPIDAIEQWISVKQIVPRSYNGKVPTTRQLAFLIARGISKNGTKPTKLLQTTIGGSDDLIAKLIDELGNQLQEEIQEEINKEEI